MDKIVTKIKPVISIIIPVFNVERYIVRCLDSIFNQKFEYPFEVIAVEDCSTDDSLKILYEYKNRISNLIIIEHKINQKLSVARRTGMEAASGEYIMHVDSDDWLLPNALENLYKKCIQTDADVIVFNYVRQSDKKTIFIKDIKKEEITSDKLSVQKYFYGATWNKIVKKKFTIDMICNQKSINSTEDLVYSTELLLRVNTICLFPQIYYSYFLNNESITSTVSSEIYLENQKVVLGQLDKILVKYINNDKFKDNVLNYFEKWIYLEFLKLHYWNVQKKINGVDYFIRELSKISILNKSRLKNYEKSMNNKYNCLFETLKRFNLRIVIGILRKTNLNP